tara:strand:+ start:1005 stop:1763 length:759 start_codon:yes stop_codon:yes gene_type:complete
MSNNKRRPWLADSNEPYHGQDPFFYDPKDFPWVEKIESNWEVLKQELMNVVENHYDDMLPYPDLEKTDKNNAWHTLGLMYWTIRSKKNINLFPKTWEIMKDIPFISSCSFHELAPYSTIKPHIGDTNAMVRCHIGIVIPEQAPRCGIRVGAETQCWQEGKILMFNDAHEHTAWNNTDSNRYVLSFDVMNPDFENKKQWIASQVLGKIFVEVLYQHNAWLRKLFSADWIKSALFFVSKGIMRLYASFNAMQRM